ncbi:MAG TPA: cell division protein SepF [Candidatus Nanoarchaeia archaeon]|nr:cell division protein SepF [Candidatus Nanoarchaeia archaeon]
MKGFFARLKDKLSGADDYDIPADGDQGYVELSSEPQADRQAKINIKPFILEDFAETKLILDALREGYTIALVNIRPLRDKDLTELKRAVSKIKKTCDALNGDIAGFGDDWICVTPSFAQIYREKKAPVGAAMPEEQESGAVGVEEY